MGFFIVLPIIMIGVALSKWKVIERAGELKVRIAVSDGYYACCGNLDES